MIKYSVQYSDFQGTEFTCEISNADYDGPVIVLKGGCTLVSAFSNDPLNPLWGRELQLRLLATIDVPLSDLWQDDEFYWTVVLKKSAQVKFIGYLSSENVFESYNTDKWDLNIKAIGPIGVIENLAYLQNTTGNPYVGFATLAQVVARIMTRGFNTTAERMEFYVFAGVNGANEVANSTGGFFDHAYIDQSIFTLDEGETYQDCQLILAELLFSAGLSMFQENGKWFILPRHREAIASGLSFKVFDADGTILRTENVTDMVTIIGAKGDASLIHCNQNQTLSMFRSVDTFALEHLSEFVGGFSANPTIINNGTIANGWTIIDDTRADLVVALGVKLKGRVSNNLISDVIMESDGYDVEKDQAFQIAIQTTITDFLHFWPVEITLESQDTIGLTWYYTGSEWTADPGGTFDKSRAYLESQNTEEVGFTIEIGSIPENGIIKMRLCEPLFLTDDHSAASEVFVSNMELQTAEGLLLGRKRIFKKEFPKRERVKDNETVRWNTKDDISLKNVFFESDLVTRIPNVKNYGGPFGFDTDELIYAVTFARALASQGKAKVFTGSVLGEVPFLGAKTYLGFASNMMAIEYSYDTERNITTLKCIELAHDYTLLGSILNQQIYTEGIKPTIVG